MFRKASYFWGVSVIDLPLWCGKHFMSSSVRVDSELFQKVKSEDLCKVCTAISSSGYEIRLVGGVVRDLLQGNSCKDIDLSTNAVPSRVAEILRSNGIRCIETGLQHGTVTAHINKRDFEITTLRADEVTDGRHAEVRFINNWKLDAERRDLTINAMSMGIDGTLYDYFDGYNDLVSKRVRFVGDTRKRIREDYLRILRYFRFLGRIASPVNFENNDSDTDDILKIISEEASGLMTVSVERLWLEFKQILVGPNAPSILRMLHKCDIFKYLRLKSVDLEKIIKFEAAYLNGKRMENSSILLHPCTLLSCLLENKEVQSSLSEMKFSRNEIALTTFIVNERYCSDVNISHLANKENTKLENVNIRPEKYEDLLVMNYKPKEEAILRDFVIQLILYEADENILKHIIKWNIPIFPVNGNDLRSLKIQGKECGVILKYLKDIWIKSRFTLTKENLLEQIKNYC